MEEPDQSPQPLASSSSSTSSSASRNEEVSSTASTSQTRDEEHEEEEEEEEEYHYQPPHLVQQQTSVSYHAHFPTSENESHTYIRDDTWSCVIVVLTFWFFVSMTMILGVYGSVTLRLGPYCSLLIKPNALLVESIKVEQLDDTISGQMLYGFYKDPPLDVVTDWSETHNASLLPRSHEDWTYFLNEGSEINISYTVKSSSSHSLILVIAQGNQGLAQWLQDPLYANSTLSWNNIHGNGLIQQDIRKSSNYYIAVGNLNSEVVEVQLNLKIRDFLYNTTEAYYKCTLARGHCSLKMFFPYGNAAVLTTPGPKQDTSSDEWYVKLSYRPRWITHLIGIGGMTVLMLLAFHFFNNFQCNRENRTGVQYGEMGSERAPLLSQKDDDLSSWGSSYDSLSQDDEDPEDGFVGSLDGKPLKDGEYNNNTRRLCAICFDAPRDCFFLPCGHCVACFACGTRIAEAAGTCPICRRNMKKVRKIFTV